MMMQVITGMSGQTLILNKWEREDGIEDKVTHNYQETLPVDLPLQRDGVPIEEVIGVPISQP